MIQNANFGRRQLGALELSNALAEYRLECIFFNLGVSLKMFHTAPVIVASVEKRFSKLMLITNYLRSTIDQDRLSNLARLSIESNIAKKDFDTVIRSFAKKNARTEIFYKFCLFTMFSIIYIFSVDCGIHEAVSIQVMNDLVIFVNN